MPSFFFILRHALAANQTATIKMLCAINTVSNSIPYRRVRLAAAITGIKGVLPRRNTK